MSIIRFSKKDARSLFLGIIFPTHFWAIILFLLTAPNPTTVNAWGEFFGIFAYILIFALFESVIIFSGLFLLTYLMPKKWEKQKNYKLTLVIFAIIVSWAAVGQFAKLIRIPPTGLFLWLVINLNNTLLYRQIAIAGIIVVVIFSVIGSIFLADKENHLNSLIAITDKITPLSYFYLLLDFFALILLITRNI